MRIEYVHASKYGNGATVADEFKKEMAAKGVAVDVHHVHDMKPKDMPPADLYVFSSPGRMGRPIGEMRRFLKRLKVAEGTRYALLVTEMEPQPDKKTGQMPTPEEVARYQRVIPIMKDLLQKKGMVEVAETKVRVTGLKGPLEDGWEKKVESFTGKIPVTATAE
jgi:multimeric flavodoxin WrbA